MTCELMLLRHGKSDWATSAGDIDRPLKERGKRDAKRLGSWLHAHGLVPDFVVTSTAKRAWGTARRAADNMGLDRDAIVQDERIYAASVPALMTILRDCPDSAKRVMLVGHNPGMEELVRHLAGDEIEVPADGKLMPTATLARLTIPGSWGDLRAGCASLDSIIRPAELQG
jgi:phosphohistidine phosphatase